MLLIMGRIKLIDEIIQFIKNIFSPFFGSPQTKKDKIITQKVEQTGVGRDAKVEAKIDN